MTFFLWAARSILSRKTNTTTEKLRVRSYEILDKTATNER